jgi:hypothetical protein
MCSPGEDREEEAETIARLYLDEVVPHMAER